jgi:capsular polysaccharide biosynthesis protein
MTTSPQYASTGDVADEDDRQRSGSGLLPFLLRAAVPVALITLLVGYVAYTRSAERTAVYSATAQVVLSSSENFSPVDWSGGSNPDRYVQNQAEIMTTVDVLNQAAAILNDGVPGSDLRGDVSAQPVTASDVINVTAEAEDPALAARRADAVANAYAQFTTAQVNALADQAAQASASNPDEVLQIRARAASFGDGVQVIQPAPVPSDPSSPTPDRDAYLAAAVAFLLSAGLALSWRSLRRPKGPEQLATAAGGPLLGEVSVPWSGSGAAVPPRLGEYAMALQALRYRLRDGAAPTFLLTEVGRGTGATSAVLGLAAAASAQGRSVVVVDASADGRLLRRIGASAPPAVLTDPVTRTGDLDQVLRRVPALESPGGGTVLVAHLSRGAVAADDVLEHSLAALVRSFDVVLVDGGTLESSAAAFALLGPVGAVVALVRGRQGGKELQEFRQRLALAGRECAGVLVTRRNWVPSFDRDVPPPPAVRPTGPAPVLERDRGAATGSTVTAGRPSS